MKKKNKRRPKMVELPDIQRLYNHGWGVAAIHTLLTEAYQLTHSEAMEMIDNIIFG